MENKITISLLDKNTIDQQVSVYIAAFNSYVELKEIRNLWEKKHFENPLGSSIIVGAFEGTKLVGLNAYMPVEYCINGEHVRMLQSCESGVLPSYQGKGIWKKIVVYALEYIENETDFKLVIGFPNYINSYPGFRKMGWKTMYNMGNYVLVNNISALKKTLAKSNPLLRLLLNGIAMQKLGVIFNKRKKFTVAQTTIDNLLWEENHPNVLTCSHETKLLRWKIDYKKLNIVCVKFGLETVATCIYRLNAYMGGQTVILESFVCNSKYHKEAKHIFASLLNHLTTTHPQAAFVRVWAQNNSNFNTLLRETLFIRSSHPNPFIINNPDSKYANTRWKLSFFDLD